MKVLLGCRDCSHIGDLEEFNGYEDYCPSCGSRKVVEIKEIESEDTGVLQDIQSDL